MKKNSLKTSARPINVDLPELSHEQALAKNGGRHHRKHPIFGLMVNPNGGGQPSAPLFGLAPNPNP